MVEHYKVLESKKLKNFQNIIGPYPVSVAVFFNFFTNQQTQSLHF